MWNPKPRIPVDETVNPDTTINPRGLTNHARSLVRADNRYRVSQGRPRRVVSWDMAGCRYDRSTGFRYPGWVKLHLDGGGFIYYTENTPIDHALNDAADLGYAGVPELRAAIDRWVKTGQGARFEPK